MPEYPQIPAPDRAGILLFIRKYASRRTAAKKSLPKCTEFFAAY
jgi:hypothetical protein